MADDDATGRSLGELGGDDACARCGRFAPTATVDPDLGDSPRRAEGWVSFEIQTLVIDIPWADDFTLPDDVVEAIRQYEDGPVRCERVGPEVTTAAVREVSSELLGQICAACLEGLDWSNEEWFAWFALREDTEDGAR